VTALLNTERKAVNGSRLLLLGMAYKKNTGDARESPAPRVARLLVAMGAQVRACDPHVDTPLPDGVEQVELTAEEVDAADLVVVLTDHDAFDFSLVARAARVLDCRRVPGLESAERL
jgi:UDP-N-acetyl-D-mannosaminuronate dehydrogenase